MKTIIFKTTEYFVNNNLISQGEILTKIKNFIQELYQDELDKIILFGSRARGDYRHDSDYDILIVLKNEFNYSQEIEKTSNFIAKLSLNYDLVISRSFTNSCDYSNSKTPFFLNVKREGIVL
jgi:predicted nucleotidyltransferase